MVRETDLDRTDIKELEYLFPCLTDSFDKRTSLARGAMK